VWYKPCGLGGALDRPAVLLLAGGIRAGSDGCKTEELGGAHTTTMILTDPVDDF